MVIKRQVTFKLSEEYYDKMAAMVGQDKEFGTFSAACEAACIEYVTLRNMRSNLGPEIARYFTTPEGKDHLKELFIQAALQANKSQ
ncbi:MAG TPA: hypothetical protein VN372_05325 [Methanospirillum sp.]|nr:hypothetical protein [Methanospirillum sp.]